MPGNPRKRRPVLCAALFGAAVLVSLPKTQPHLHLEEPHLSSQRPSSRSPVSMMQPTKHRLRNDPARGLSLPWLRRIPIQR